MSKTVAALQYAFEGRNLAAENHQVVVYAAERRRRCIAPVQIRT